MEFALIILGPVFLFLSYVIIKLYKYNRSLNKELAAIRVENRNIEENKNWLVNEYNSLQTKYSTEQEKNKKIISQKKSSEVKLGQITEHIVPFLSGVPYDPQNLHFLGMPVDFIHFDWDEAKITFIEVKSGNSRPSKRQKVVKNIIKQGQVFYDEIRVNEKGVKIKGKK